MNDDNNIFDENDMTGNNNPTESSQTPEHHAQSQENPYGYQQSNPQGNYYQQNNQQGNYYQQPYGQYQQTGANGKKIGQGFGIASLVLGIISLILFCTCINIVLAIVAIIFGIIQIVKYEKKGMAIGGIATAGASILLFFICMGLLVSNQDFIRSIEQDIITYENDFDSNDVEDWNHMIEKYTNGNYDINVEGSDEDGNYNVHISPNEDGTPQVDVQSQDGEGTL